MGFTVEPDKVWPIVVFSGGCGILPGIMNRGRTEVPGREEKLSSAEVAVEAKRLMGAFRDTLKIAPEFSASFVDGYFREEPDHRRDLGHKPVLMQRGSYLYSIVYYTERGLERRLQQELQIVREPFGADQQEIPTEKVKLSTESGSDKALILYKKGKRDALDIWSQEGLEFHVFSPSAISKVEGFLVDFQQGV